MSVSCSATRTCGASKAKAAEDSDVAIELPVRNSEAEQTKSLKDAMGNAADNSYGASTTIGTIKSEENDADASKPASNDAEADEMGFGLRVAFTAVLLVSGISITKVLSNMD